MKLAIGLATRNRPQQVLQTLTRHMQCLSRPDTKMIVQCDADDLPTIITLSNSQLDPRVVINAQKREDTIAAKWNRTLAEPADVYLAASDDDPYVTPNLDEKILAAANVFPDGIGAVYGRLANASFPGVIAYTAKWAEKLGWLQPEFFPYWFADHWCDDIARIIGRISFADVTTDQSKTGQTMELREPAWWATWFDAAYLMRRAQALKLLKDGDFQSPDWVKEMQAASAPLVEFRSRWVNDTVRAQSKQLEMQLGAQPPDDRYRRTKAAAVALLPHLLDDYGMDKQEATRFRELLDPPATIAALPRAYA